MRLSSLARDQRFHPDEALYADLSRRVGMWGDWQLLYITVDKPPLFHFVGGFFYFLLGDSEFSTRLPNAFASLITLALLYTLVRRLSGRRSTASIAVLMVALSPLDIALSISGFADSQMMLWLMLSAVLMQDRQWGKSGLALGLAVAVKPPALWFVPVILALAQEWSPHKLWRWGRGILLIVILITLWDISGTPISVWTSGGSNYLPHRMIHLDEIIPRTQAWLEWGQYVLPIGGFLLGIYLFIAQKFMPGTKYARLFLTYTLVYLLLHWLIPFNIYDRYLLLILLPLVMAITLPIRFSAKWMGAIAMIILITGIYPAWQANQGKTPLASDQGKHTGIDQVAAVINSQYAGEVFYENWLGWELRYYLTADPHIILVWQESPEALVEYAREEFATMDVPRYFVATTEPRTVQWIESIERQGLFTQKVYDDGRYVIYAIAEDSFS